MATNGANRFKLTAYNYDLISGKVNQVHYQPGEKDQFYHRYEYDAENRITGLYTTDVKGFVGTGSNEDHEALYQYYKHGPLARMLLGHQQVQGIDYAYSLQGWLKGVNSTSLMPDRDMGEDDGTFIARAVYGFNLNYFTGDYSAIHDTKIPFPGHTAFMPSGEYKGLYNGNISSMAVNIAPPLGGVGGGPQLAMDSLNYNYFTDAGGNKRNNRLRMVRDAVNAANYTEDIDDQLSSVNNVADSNYVYDEIGNLVQDKSEKITSIKWNVYGKILEIDKTPTTANPVTKISYSYDAAGNRISKKTEKGETGETTWYVRDAQGNVLGVYTDKNALTLTEHHIYGSSRLGIANRNLTVADPSITGTTLNLLGSSYLSNFERGKKFFELSNHLGNVLITISDRKLQITNSGSVGEDNGGCEIGSGVDVLDVSTRNGELSYTARTEINLLPGFESNGTTDIYDAYIDNSLDTCVPYTPPAMSAQGWYYAADVLSANDYYPGGMLMPGRKLSNGSYRYGFNGKEKSDEIENDDYDFDARILNTKLGGRWMSTDPKANRHPGESPYVFCSNNPIIYVDQDGKDKIYSVTVIGKDGKSLTIKTVDKNYFVYKKVDAPGFGNNRYYKSDLIINETVDLRVGKKTTLTELGDRKEVSAGDYLYVKAKNFFNSYSSGTTAESRGSQTGGTTFTSEFSDEADGQKTDATKGSSGMTNVDLLMAAVSAYAASNEALGLSIETIPEWTALIKDAIEAGETLKKKNEENSKDNSVSKPPIVKDTIKATSSKDARYDPNTRKRIGYMTSTSEEILSNNPGTPDTIRTTVYPEPPQKNK